MLYYFGMIMAVIGAGVLIGALTYVTLLLTVVIMSMFAFTGRPDPGQDLQGVICSSVSASLRFSGVVASRTAPS